MACAPESSFCGKYVGLAESENLWGGDVVGRALQKGSGSAQASSSLQGKSFDQMS